MKDNSFVPMGHPETKYPSGTYCSTTSNDSRNGYGCAFLATGNPDYFKNLGK